MKKTKVCFISYYAYRLFNEKSQITFSGNEVLFYLMIQELIKDNRFEVSFILEDDLHKNPKTEIINGVKLFKTSRKEGLKSGRDKKIDKFVQFHAKAAKRIDWLWQLPHQDFFRLWERFKTIQADVYIQGSATYETGLIYWLTRFFRKKFIFLIGWDGHLDKKLIKKQGLKGKIYKSGLKNADIVFCHSTRHQKLLKKGYRLDSILLPYWYPVQKKVLELNERKYIFWIARMEGWKRPDLFLKLAKSFPKEKFIMIGAFPKNQFQLFKKIQKQVKLLPNVTLKKNVAFSKVADYYKQAKIFVETSNYGNMHTSHLMSAAFGTPCLSLFQDPNNSFKEYDWGISAEGKYEKLVKNVKLILDKPKLWEKLSKNAIYFSQTYHNINDRVEDFKKNLLKLSKND